MKPLVALLCCFPALAQVGPCWPDSPQRLAYPEIARQARIQGAVKLHFQVDGIGHARAVTLVSGHPLMAEDVKQFVERASFPVSCMGSTLNYAFEFVLDTPATPSTQFTPPDSYGIQVVGDSTVIVDNSTKRPPWWRRIFR